MEKINIAELLKDCPKGMELNCTMYEDVYFDYVDELNIIHCYIQHETYKTYLTFNQHGTPNSDIKSKCVIFPKGKTTWEGFTPPCKFKDGDVIYTDNFIAILSHITERGAVWYHCYYCIYTKKFKAKRDFGIGNINYDEFRLATEEEKQKLFKAIKDNGYKWNEETKTLEELVEPEFKVGDKIKHKENTRWVCTITMVTDRYYVDGHPMCFTLPFGKQNEYELVPNKFDFTTLKPFDNCKYSLDGGKTWKFAQYWYVQDKYDVNEIEIDLWLN